MPYRTVEKDADRRLPACRNRIVFIRLCNQLLPTCIAVSQAESPPRHPLEVDYWAGPA
jgi:hypothetical protein